MDSRAIFTVVSRPGAAELRLLSQLGQPPTPRRRVGAGVALRTIETTPAPASDGPTVVFLAGRGHSAAMWAAQITHFRERARIVAFDLPGFGHSGASPTPPRTAEEALSFFVDPIAAALEGLGPLVLVGHSLGGLVALEMSLSRKLPIERLVLIGSMGLSPYVTPRARAYLRIGPERLSRFADRFRMLREGLLGSAAAEDLTLLRRELHAVPGGRPLAKRAFDRLVPLFGHAFSRRERLSELLLPVLLIWGDSDEAFPLPIAVAAQKLIPNAELAVMAGGHCPHFETPDLVSARLGSFLEPLL